MICVLARLVGARRRLLWQAAATLTVAAALAGAVEDAAVAWVDHVARGSVYQLSDVPATPVALVLGAQVLPDETPSRFLRQRLELAQQLYDAGKVRVLLVSGDNGRPDYDEPDAMRAWLVAHGVPARKIVTDYAGFDTYDSCLRANKIFGVRQVIVVSQAYHVPRAVALCRRLGVRAVGVGDPSSGHSWVSWQRAAVRERGACVKAFVDLAIRRPPVRLGPHETGVEDALRD